MKNTRPMFEVKTSGMFLEDVHDWDEEIRSLTTEIEKEEAHSRYLKYANRMLVMPPHENLAAAERGCPIDPSEAVKPEDYVRTMDSEAIESLKMGYCVFEDGTGYAMSRIPLPGLTDEKLDYFNKHFNPEHNLFYKCWCPGYHMKHYVNGAIEDVGAGMELLQFLSGYDLDTFSGIRDYQVKDPLFIDFVGGGGTSWPLHHLYEQPRWAIQTSWWRDLPDKNGREVFITFWHGMKWENGKARRAIPLDARINPEDLRCQCYHSSLEISQIPYLVNTFWDDNH